VPGQYGFFIATDRWPCLTTLTQRRESIFASMHGQLLVDRARAIAKGDRLIAFTPSNR